jgi:hypothetical protein
MRRVRLVWLVRRASFPLGCTVALWRRRLFFPRRPPGAGIRGACRTGLVRLIGRRLFHGGCHLLTNFPTGSQRIAVTVPDAEKVSGSDAYIARCGGL